jgi:hypothetical protein
VQEIARVAKAPTSTINFAFFNTAASFLFIAA